MIKKLSVFFRDLGPLRFFLITASFFGLVFVFLTPPFQGADEEVHFLRAYQVSTGNFVVDQVSGTVGGYLPTSLGKTVSLTDTPAIQFYPQLKYKESKTHSALSVRLNPGKQAVYDFGATTEYPPVPYLPASFGILIGRLARLPPIMLLYLGRLGDLIAWICLVGGAIKLIPRKKWALTAVGLLPMALFQASTLNGDVVTVGSTILFIALILKLREKIGAVTRREGLALLLVGLTMALSKEIMFLFLPAILLMSAKKFQSTRQAKLAKLSLIGVPLLAFVGWFWVIHGIQMPTPANAVPTAQLKFILKNPYSYVNVLWNTFFYTWGNGVTNSFIGTFGWADTPLAELLVVIGYLGLAFLTMTSTRLDPVRWLSKREKWLVSGIGLVYFLAVSTSLYVYYSPVGFKIIVGLQGRYFLPLGLLAIPLLYNKAVITKEKLYRHTAIGLPLFLLLASTITIYVRYFINNV